MRPLSRDELAASASHRRRTAVLNESPAQQGQQRRPRAMRKPSRRLAAATHAQSARVAAVEVTPRTYVTRVRDAAAVLGSVVSYVTGQVRLLSVLLNFAQGMLGRALAILQWLNDYPARVQFRRTTQRFLSVMNTTESYATFVEAAASLDHYCGVAKWAQEAPPLGRCNAVGLLVDATAAQHLVRTQNVFGMETFLCSLLKRNAHGLMDASIYHYSHTAPHCLEDYTDSMEALITAYAAAAAAAAAGWRGESPASDGGAAADRRPAPLPPVPPMRELRPCWVRLEPTAASEARSPQHPSSGHAPRPAWTAPASRPPAALPTVDVTPKIQHMWHVQLRRAALGPPAPWMAATAAPSRTQSVSTCMYNLGSSGASAGLVPLTETSTGTMRTNASTVPGEESVCFAEDESTLLLMAASLSDARRTGELASASQHVSPFVRTYDGCSATAAAASVSSWTSTSLSPPLVEAALSAARPSPEVALAQQIRGSCASLCRFLDGCASPSTPLQAPQPPLPPPLAHHQLHSPHQLSPQPRCPPRAPVTATPAHRLGVLREVLRSFGRTALVLSGGASMGTYHAGVARALYEAGVLPDILCGSSAGSIIAAMICTKSPEELHAFMQSHVLSTEAMHMSPFGEDSGLLGKLQRLFKTGFLMDVRSLMECMRGQCGDMTFLEAYQLSGKVLNVSVTRSQQEGTPTDRHALLNYVTAPDVVIWSAVSASCALPGLFTAVQLIEKPSLGAGTFAPYLPGELWCDGSVAQDIPRRLLTQLFGVSYLVVSQVNPYVIPFLRPPPSYHLTATGLSWFARLWFAWVAVCRWVLTVLFSLHLLPRIGRGEVLFLPFAQFYGGDITIQPVDSVMTAVPDYLNLVNNPSADYISYVASRAQSRTWPLVTRIRLATSIERCLQREIRALEAIVYGDQAM